MLLMSHLHLYFTSAHHLIYVSKVLFPLLIPNIEDDDIGYDLNVFITVIWLLYSFNQPL